MKNKLLHLIIGLVLLTMATACCDKQETTEVRKGNYRIIDNTIVFDEPQRIEGQKSVLQFTVDPIENVRIGFIGLGMRGPDAVDRMTYIDGVTVVALCDIEPDRVEGGHGGMDFVMDYRLIYCLQHGLPLDQDVYDAAEWSCLGELTAASIANGGMPVQMPDFTRGDWDKVQGYRHAQ